MEMNKEGNIVATPAEFAILAKIQNSTKKAKAASSKTKIGTLNGAPMDVEPEVKLVTDGSTEMLRFYHKQYKGARSTLQKGKEAKYVAVADLITAQKQFENGEISSTNRMTGTKFTLINNAPVGENLVKWGLQYVENS